MSWQQFFRDPIELPDGRVLRSLRDAGEFIQMLPKATQDRLEWQAAVQALITVVEHNGDTLPVRMAIVRALNASRTERRRGGKPPETTTRSDKRKFNLERKHPIFTIDRQHRFTTGRLV
ncbi:hypothetical protein [Bradyrhizobium sp.]|uniref:hypothetical protein n=1 Tax=Bradyrhizobium sp. TaxID=376 RepID=UPI001EC37CEB|nr:hypothetical protein [Bradyrhizobium sp.]MBV9985704.1 hypothetical protein [Bradyrhizobium sp.]